MFFETTYVPSPQLSVTSTLEEDGLTPPPLSPSLGPSSAQGDSSGDEASSESPVDHLIFVIHGIGQQTEQYGHFYEHIDNLRETTRQVLQAKVPDHAVRIELIPIEWHRHIHEQTDPTMGRITLKSIPTIRLIENDYLADILYYFSKERGQSIVDNVTNLFNTSYHNFLEKHPDFAGKIVIIGYSLGGIITWDILSHQRQPETPEEEAEYRKIDVKYSKLDFKPNYFFGFGSPLAAMLTIRNQSPLLYHPDHDIVFENVFHPFDPLAYRFEPLINEYYTDQPAVLVERSVPLGPSFSFPSLPSIPGAGILSFFSWKASASQQQQQRRQQQSSDNTNSSNEEAKAAQKMTMQATNMAAKAGQQHSRDDARSAESIVANARSPQPQQNDDDDQQQQQQESKKFISSFNSFLQYFSSPSSSTQRKKQKRQQQEQQKQKKEDEQDKADEQQEQHMQNENTMTTTTTRDSVPGIITWDPLQDAVKDQMLGLKSNHSEPRNHDDNDSLQQEEQQQQRQLLQKEFLKRPVIRSRSQTFGGSPQEFHTVKNTIHSNKDSTVNTSNKSHKHQRHLVEVLGIDGVRMDSWERAQMNFSPDNRNQQQQQQQQQYQNEDVVQLQQQERKEHQEEKQQPQGKKQEPQQDAKTASSGDANDVNSTDTVAGAADGDTVNAKTVTEEQDKNSSSSKGDLWSDLNQELNEPGPAVTEPGQSKEEVTKDATQPKGSSNGINTDTNADDGTKKSKEDKKAEDAKQQTKLPGGRRIDHVLQPESFMSMIANEYLVGLRAHFSYWTNKDLLWHIVCRLENLEEVIASSNNSTRSTTHSSAGGGTNDAPAPIAGSPSSSINKE